jgi:hypothetical protein
LELNGRTVTDVEIDGVDPKDYPDFCDAYFSHAIYADTKEPLSDEELETLADQYPEIVNAMAYEHFI